MTRLKNVALKQEKAPLVLKNGRVINVFNKQIEKGDIAIFDGRIVGIGSYSGEREIDLRGSFVCPGFFDAHVHIESSMLTPEKFARAVMPFGTTSVIADPHEITNVCGLKGIDFMLDSAKQSLLDVYMMMPSCVPATPFDTSGFTVTAEDMASYHRKNEIFGLGEVMDMPQVNNDDPRMMKKLDLFRSRPIDGHAPMVAHDELNLYLYHGIQTDHESSTKEEMIEKVSKGLYVMLRQGSATRNVEALAPFVEESFSRRLLFCTDDKHPSDILKEGHINHNINLAIRHGVDPITAIQMATLNPAVAYSIKQKGAVAPGYHADLVVFDDLSKLIPRMVFKDGELVAENGRFLLETKTHLDASITKTMHVDAESIDLSIPLSNPFVHVIGFQPNNVTTSHFIREVKSEGGFYQQTPTLDVLMLFVIERHHQSGRVGKALIEGYGLRNGAVGLSIAHDSHNLIVIGDNQNDIRQVIRQIQLQQGGIAVSGGGKILANLPLEIGGIMTDDTAESVMEKLETMEKAIRHLGVKENITDPFLNLAFLSLAVIPSLKCTDFGLFDTIKGSIIPLEV